MNEPELAQSGLIPPLHPNCQCRIIALDRNGIQWYLQQGDDFIRDIDRALDNMGKQGGLFMLDPWFHIKGVSEEFLHPVYSTGQFNVIYDANYDNWWDKILEWQEKFDRDAQAFGESVGRYLADVYEYYDGNMLLVALEVLGGLARGIIDGVIDRGIRLFTEHGNELYNILNSLSFGLGDLIGEVIYPKEAGSFAHVMSIVQLATYLFFIFEAASSAGAKVEAKLDLLPGAGAVTRAEVEATMERVFATDYFKPQNLMDELAASGVKYSVDDVLMVVKTPDGQLLWLEKGRESAGLEHILLRHKSDFMNRGITDIPGVLGQYPKRSKA